MIRISDKSDIIGIINLWREAFGDSENEILFFLDNRYKPENTLVAEENGKIASMLFLLEGKMKINGICYPSFYLYAACTLKEFRGKGLMASLLKFAKETASDRNIDFICLLPAEESLYKFYESHNYKTVFSKKVYVFSRENIADSTVNTELFCNLEETRNKAFEDIDMFKWDNDSLDFAFEHNSFYGGQALIGNNGYALFNVTEQDVYIKECTLTDEVEAVVSTILNKYPDINKIVVDLPVGIKTAYNNYEIVDSGMALAVSKKAEILIDEIKDAYLGLTLN